jgi:hypothetical protein
MIEYRRMDAFRMNQVYDAIVASRAWLADHDDDAWSANRVAYGSI